MKFLFAVLGLLTIAWPSFVNAESRIKDIATVQGIRDNQLIGYGLVIGLAGTGDSFKTSPFTEVSMRSMLQRMGVALGSSVLQSKNVAAVVVTANLLPFVARGTRLDVTVSALGDATSLSGGTLIMTPLLAATGEVFAVAQGSVTINGFKAEGAATTITQGVATTGRVPNGAIVERENTIDFNATQTITFQLQNPDFVTASRIAASINKLSKIKFGRHLARTVDFRSVEVLRPIAVPASNLIAELEQLPVEADGAAKVVVDERSGTIVIGENVRISPVAISHGNITIKIVEQPVIVQPKPFANGNTTSTPSTDIQIEAPNDPVAILRGPTLEKLVKGLNKMGLRPPEIISILQTIKSAGALQAELVVQ